ncbi:glycoside hydrolase [Aquibacillus sediminis]|uniref:glycoside hydrolase n=1 Tax=Aquibacillus sediminis TaxID=2574734 RepID=UPI0011099AA4|nr:glycoside hydrolase [Aquibacillus sediminis]
MSKPRWTGKVFSSFLVLILILSSLLPAGNVFAAEDEVVSSTVYWNDVRQEIDGFGASGAFQQAQNLMEFPEEKREEILDLLFSTTDGAGFSIVRNKVGDGGLWGNEIDGPTPTIWPEEDGDFVWSGDEDQVWLMNQAKEYGVDKFISTVWSPPAWMKTNSQVKEGGKLEKEHYQDYADYLSAYIRGYKEHHDIEIDGISIQNEPDLTVGYSSARWTGEEFNDFIGGYLSPTFEEDEITADVILGEDSSFVEDPAIPVLQDPETRDDIDIVAAHAYNDGRGAETTFPTAKKYDKRIWQTEVSNLGENDPTIEDGIYWAQLVHDHMTNAEVNAWLYWWFIAYKLDKGEPLINLDVENKEYYLNKRLFTIGNFSRFVRPGYNRISTSDYEDGVDVSAYKDEETGEYAVVVINSNETFKTLDLNFDGFNSGLVTDSVTPYRTSATENLKELDSINVDNGSVSSKLPPKSVTTFVGKAEEVTSDLLAPLDEDKINKVNQNSTVPVKFTLNEKNGGNIDDADAKLYLAKVTDGAVGVVQEATATGNKNNGNSFHYNGNGQYMYNLNTKQLDTGKYQLKIETNGHILEKLLVEII